MACQCYSRRHLLTGTFSVLLSGSPFDKLRAAVPTACASFGEAQYSINYRRRASSDNAKLDEAVINELKKILTIMPINPQFQYIDEDVPNSFALPTSDVLGTKGTVLLGLKMLNSLLNEPDGAAAIAGVCAHECAHIQQYFSDSFNHLSSLGTIAVELHADLVAGYYMGKRGDADAKRVKAFALMLFNHTEYGYTDPNFHGSPGERAAAVDRGYFMAQQNVPFREACTKGEAYIKNLIGL